jgi:hypothetical protein
MNPFNFLDGYKTYVAAAGLIGLALFQFSSGDYPAAWQSMMAGLAAFGLKHAVSRAVDAAPVVEEEVK